MSSQSIGKTPKKKGKPNNALEDFINSDSTGPQDFFSSSDDDLAKDILGESDELPYDVLSNSKAGADDVFSGSQDLPDELSPENDDLPGLGGLDPFSEDSSGNIEGDLASLLSKGKSPVKKVYSKPASLPQSAAAAPPKKNGRPVSIGGEEELFPPLKKPEPPLKSPGGPAGLEEARKKASAGKWEEVIAILGPIFAGNRTCEVGVLLANAYLRQKKPDLASELLTTLEFDRELLADDLKDVIYRVGLALEELGKGGEALSLYDIICNVDINYLDVFDRSDRLYNSRKKDSAA